jgi:hypothetical protein
MSAICGLLFWLLTLLMFGSAGYGLYLIVQSMTGCCILIGSFLIAYAIENRGQK